MHLANQMDHLERMTCEAMDLLAVALMHHSTEEKGTEEGTFTRESYLKEPYARWNTPRADN